MKQWFAGPLHIIAYMRNDFFFMHHNSTWNALGINNSIVGMLSDCVLRVCFSEMVPWKIDCVGTPKWVYIFLIKLCAYIRGVINCYTWIIFNLSDTKRVYYTLAIIGQYIAVHIRLVSSPIMPCSRVTKEVCFRALTLWCLNCRCWLL